MTPKPPLQILPAPLPPCVVDMAACSPNYSKLWIPPKNLGYEIALCYIVSTIQKLFLTVVLLEHFCVEQLGHHIIFHIHQEKDV